MSDRGGFEVVCPTCGDEFVAYRPERLFRQATPESTAPVPPDLRTPPKHHALRIVTCAHCCSQFRPARGTRNPRFCSKSCARRAKLADLHGFQTGQPKLC
jgi:endogenous inhibitor of DNA gyrase (YacG/DUF329 family)